MLVSNLPIDRLSLPGRFVAFAYKDTRGIAIMVEPSYSEAEARLMAQSMVEKMEQLGTDKAWLLSER